MIRQFFWRALAILALQPFAGAGAQDIPQASVEVDTRKTVGPVNRLVFGHNIEAAEGQHIFGPNPAPKPTGDGFWDPAKAEPVPELVEESKRLGVSMWRYPGGCLAHGFDWKKTIGPAAARPDFAFGLDEFLRLCEATGSTPLVTVSDYTGTPQDAADLVEYLNAPATPEHPWAMKRAANGRKAPWAVRYFEMGNETDHGNHEIVPRKVWSAQEYVNWFNTCAKLMRAVDPQIKLGALTGTNTGPFDPWNQIVARGVKDSADYVIIHTYAVGLWSPDKPSEASPDLVSRAAVSSVLDFEDELADYNSVLRKASGRNFPLAITEYNALMVHPATDPVPFRYTWGTALFCADYIRLLLEPKTNVLMAHYWHMLNGYFGFLHGPDDVSKVSPEERKWNTRPAYEVFRLWASHTGDEIVESKVDGPQLTFEGFGRTRARGVSSSSEAEVPAITFTPEAAIEGVRWKTGEGGIGSLSLEGQTGEQYVPIGKFPLAGGGVYRLTFEAKFSGDPGTLKLGMGLGDARGWDKTQSAIAIQGIDYATDWQSFSGDLSTLGDAQDGEILWRILNANGKPVNGLAELRNIKVVPVPPSKKFPAVTSLATVSTDRRTLYLMLINKDDKHAIETRINLESGSPGEARIWTVTGPALSTFTAGPEGVRETNSGSSLTRQDDRSYIVKLPPASMNAIEITLNPAKQ